MQLGGWGSREQGRVVTRDQETGSGEAAQDTAHATHLGTRRKLVTLEPRRETHLAQHTHTPHAQHARDVDACRTHSATACSHSCGPSDGHAKRQVENQMVNSTRLITCFPPGRRTNHRPSDGARHVPARTLVVAKCQHAPPSTGPTPQGTRTRRRQPETHTK